ncbi:MAG: ABC transporter permease, partial [Betaproteobacteria bacterium]
MNTLALALRNLMRNRRRSITTLLAMGIGAVTILIFGGYSRDITYALQTGYVLRGGHLQVQRKDYFLYGTGNPAAYGIAGYQRVLEVIGRDPVLAPMLRVVTPTISLGGIAGNFAAGVSRTVIGSGVVVADRNRMRQWNDYQLPLRIGQSPLTGTSDESVVVGNGVARVLELCGALAVPNCKPKAKPPAPSGPSAPADITALAALESRPVVAKDEARIEL